MGLVWNVIMYGAGLLALCVILYLAAYLIIRTLKKAGYLKHMKFRIDFDRKGKKEEKAQEQEASTTEPENE